MSFVGLAWRCRHEGGRVDEVVQITPDHVEIFVALTKYAPWYVGCANSLGTAEVVLASVLHDNHVCTDGCRGSEEIS
jgi:hypothetical protein